MQVGVVSVIIPVYNGARFLPDAVACVRSQNVPVEIIIVNDGSTDDTVDIAAGFSGITYIEQENAGPAAARNRGIEAAQGELLAFLDVDDLWTPSALRMMCSYVQSTDAEIVHGRMQCIQMENDGAIRPLGDPGRSTQMGSMLFRRSVFATVGLFDETLRYSEDTDWFMRASDRGVAKVIIDDVVLLYRMHEQSTTHGRTADELNILHVLRAAIRRRAENDQA